MNTATAGTVTAVVFLLGILPISLVAQSNAKICGFVIDRYTQKPFPAAQIIIKDHQNIELDGMSRVRTDKNGYYEIVLPADSSYHITAGIQTTINSETFGFVMVSSPVHLVQRTRVDFTISEKDLRAEIREHWQMLHNDLRRRSTPALSPDRTEVLVNRYPQKSYISWVQRVR